ncbi:MAG: hypothetical protein AB7P07_09630 [Hyphomonadaceae bacterium]
MIAPATVLDVAILAAALLLVFGGGALAWASFIALKRVLGLLLVFLGAVLGLALLGAPSGVLMASVAVALVNLSFGFALCVRLQEVYGGGDLDQIDSADANADDAEGAG